jgi:thymidylate synthase
MFFVVQNVNEAFRTLTLQFHNRILPIVATPSRVGDCLRVRFPVLVTFREPRQKVLFNRARDANPYFHVIESLWMLAGRNDVATLAYYNSNIAKVASDDGEIFHGCYGFRWRHWFGVDQLPVIVDHLKRVPDSRRVVLEMWSPEGDLVPVDGYGGVEGTKDVPCNTQVYFEIQEGRLDMTVTNRSNDMVWGMLGANVVHFAFLQEYMAAMIGIPTGYYHQFTNNLHVYTERWTPVEYLNDEEPDHYKQLPRMNVVPLVSDPDIFDRECSDFVAGYCGEGAFPSGGEKFKTHFLSSVAWPMVKSYRAYKANDLNRALDYANEVMADDWRRACVAWMTKRKLDRQNKEAPPAGTTNPYIENERKRVLSGSEQA